MCGPKGCDVIFTIEVNLAWIIHELRLPKMRGVADEAVVAHRKSVTTKQMRQDQLAQRVKNVDY